MNAKLCYAQYLSMAQCIYMKIFLCMSAILISDRNDKDAYNT